MKSLKKILVFLTVAALGLAFLLFGQSVATKLGVLENTEKVEEKIEPSVAPESQLKFAVMSDIHLDTENLEKALSQAKADAVDFAVITGDMTSLGKKEELRQVKKVLDDSGLKYYAIPGNHDHWASNQFKTDIYGEVFDYKYLSFRQNGTKFILIDNGNYSGLGAEQKNWFKEEVKDCLQINCLVFVHIPLNHPLSLHIMGEDNPKVASEAAEIVKTLVDNKVQQVFAGHLHYSSEYEIDGLKTTVVGAVTRNRNIQSPKFIEVWGDGGQWNKKEVFLND
jgi:Icc protein